MPFSVCLSPLSPPPWWTSKSSLLNIQHNVLPWSFPLENGTCFFPHFIVSNKVHVMSLIVHLKDKKHVLDVFEWFMLCHIQLCTHTHTHTHKITCLLSASSIMRPPGLIKREHRSSLGKKLIVNLCSMGAYHFYCSGYQAAFTTQITLRIVFIQKKQSFIWYKEMKLQQILNLWAVAFWWLWRLVLLQHLYTYAEVCFSRGRIHQILKRM